MGVSIQSLQQYQVHISSFSLATMVEIRIESADGRITVYTALAPLMEYYLLS